MNGCCTGAADGGVQHRRAGVEAEFVRHVRTRPEQRHNERLPRTGEPSPSAMQTYSRRGVVFVRKVKI